MVSLPAHDAFIGDFLFWMVRTFGAYPPLDSSFCQVGGFFQASAQGTHDFVEIWLRLVPCLVHKPFNSAVRKRQGARVRSRKFRFPQKQRRSVTSSVSSGGWDAQSALFSPSRKRKA